MNQERLAEITAANADGRLWSADVVGELLDYVGELKHNLRSAGECIDAYMTAFARAEAENERLKTERDRGILEYLHTHHDDAVALVRREQARLGRRNIYDRGGAE